MFVLFPFLSLMPRVFLLANALAFSSLHLQNTSPFLHYSLSYLIYIPLLFAAHSASLLPILSYTIWLPTTCSMYILHALCPHVCCTLLLNPDIVLWSSFDPMMTSLSLCLTVLLSHPIMSLSHRIGNVGQVSPPSLYF